MSNNQLRVNYHNLTINEISVPTFEVFKDILIKIHTMMTSDSRPTEESIKIMLKNYLSEITTVNRPFGSTQNIDGN